MKRTIVTMLLVVMLALCSCGSSSGYEVPGIDGSLSPHTFVRNGSDDTKVVLIAQAGLDPTSFAYDYYKTCFEPGDVAHYVYNMSTKVCTEIRNIGGVWFVTVREYVDGEEHDQKEAGAGMLLSEYMMDPETGNLDQTQ